MIVSAWKRKVLYVVTLSHLPSFYFFGFCRASVPPQELIKFIYPCYSQAMHVTTQTALITAAKIVFEAFVIIKMPMESCLEWCFRVVS